MIEFMNLVTTMSPNFGSGMTSRFSALWRRDMSCSVLIRHGRTGRHLVWVWPGGPDPKPRKASCSALRRLATRLLRPLGAVLGPALLPVLHALRVEHAAENVVAHARQVLDAAAADHDDRVLLQ